MAAVLCLRPTMGSKGRVGYGKEKFLGAEKVFGGLDRLSHLHPYSVDDK